jgi:endopeptidase La
MTDIDNLIQFINKTNSKKRKAFELDDTDVVKTLHTSAFGILTGFTDMFNKKIKGRELNKILLSIKNKYIDEIKFFKTDKQFIKKEPEILRLLLIAITTICVDIINKMYKYILDNRDKTYDQVLKYISDEMGYNVPDKKPKLIFKLNNISKEEEEEDYDDYGDDDDDDDDGDDDSDDEEEDEDDYKYKFNKKEETELLELLYKNDIDDADDVLVKYYSKLSKLDRTNIMNNLKDVKNYQSNIKPIILQIMDFPLPLNQKNHIIKNYNNLMNSRFPDNKLRTWFDALMTIPFGKYKGINLNSMESKDVKKFLDNLQESMDKAVYGHNEAKHHIIQIMAQQIRNPKSKGNVMGICGVPGNGKTSIVKEGIAKAMDKPFIFISLGGATDSSFLEGHSFTYEGSVCGRIVNGLISSKCMDPIIYFDELDKISKTPKGDEIVNTLIHLTDPAQNAHFRDKYFHGVDIDLSRATIIFSFNDSDNVSPILMDRITVVETKYLLKPQKINIANDYLLPEILKDVGLKDGDVLFEDEVVSNIISNYTREGGVRKLKSLLYSIVRELNISNLLKTRINNKKVKFPFTVENDDLKLLLKDHRMIEPETIHKEDQIGVMNGLWANSYGNGGILEIQSLWIPTATPFEIRATGNLQQVIKESTMVASTLAFNYLDKELQNTYLSEWKKRPQGIHLHFPDGATPKDGPSAGGALAVTIYSLLSKRKIKHDVAMTGEINFQGRITAIGGLENKLEGAKRAGVKLALYPKENQKDMDKIYERNPSLVDESFNVIAIDTLEEAIQHTII